jgi:hypothetical protein
LGSACAGDGADFDFGEAEGGGGGGVDYVALNESVVRGNLKGGERRRWWVDGLERGKGERA